MGYYSSFNKLVSKSSGKLSENELLSSEELVLSLLIVMISVYSLLSVSLLVFSFYD